MNEKDTPELKKCPFCGKNAKAIFEKGMGHRVICMWCYATTPNYRPNAEMAFVDWNTRAAMPDTTAQADTVTPHYCYDPDSWEYTMQWSQREELVEDWNCGQAHKVATLIQGPDKWVAHIPIDATGFGDADDLETRWFDSEESALRAIAGESQ